MIKRLAKRLPIVLAVFLIASMLVSIFPQNTYATGWYDANWLYRKSVTVSNPSNDYQTPITIHYGAGSDTTDVVYLNSHCRTDFGDVRFTASDGTTLLPIWRESKTDSGQTLTWVRNGTSASTAIYIYYGNAAATYPYLATDLAQGEATFLFFDNFGDFDFTVERYSGNPVISAEAPGDWRRDATVFYDGTYYYMVIDYVVSGDYAIAIYRSSLGDGSDWTFQYAIEPLETEVAIGDCHIFKSGNTWYIFYQDAPQFGQGGDAGNNRRICLMTSTDIADSASWVRDSQNPLLVKGTSGWDNLCVIGVCVIKYGTTWYMFYIGKDNSGSYHGQLGVATTSEADFPHNWAKYENNPIAGAAYLPWGVETPTVIKRGSTFLMMLTEGQVGGYIKERVWKSTDLLAWTEVPSTIILDKVAGGWESAYAAMAGFFCSDVYGTAEGNNQRIIYSGSNSGTGTYVKTGQATIIGLDSIIAFNGLAKWSGDIAYGSVANSILTFAGIAGFAKAIYSAVQTGDIALRMRANLQDADYSEIALSQSALTNYLLLAHVSGSTNHTQWNTSDGAEATTSNTAAGFGNYHLYDFCRVETGTDTGRFYLDGVQIGSDFTSHVATGDLSAMFRAINSNILCDWILVRKYALTEPTWGSWGSEETVSSPPDNPCPICPTCPACPTNTSFLIKVFVNSVEKASWIQTINSGETANMTFTITAQ